MAPHRSERQLAPLGGAIPSKGVGDYQGVSGQKLLFSIVQATETTDSERFRRSLAETVRELIPVYELVFVKPSMTVGLPHQIMHAESLRSANPLDLAHVHDLVDQALTSDNLMLLIRSGERLTMDAQAATVVLPVLIRDCLTEVVIMRAREIARPALEMMKAFVRLYRNFQALIVEGQVDGLTGLNNRKTLESALSSVIRATREANPAMANLAPGRRRIGCQHVFLAIIDIDHFKRINDTLGHLFGDEVIVLIARFMRDAFRNEDMLFRFGGEEFVAVLVADSELDARAALERFRHRVSEYRFPQLDQVTVSIGMVEVTAGDVSTTTLGKADQALYFSKTNGRNQTTSYEELCRIGAVHNDIETGAVELF